MKNTKWHPGHIGEAEFRHEVVFDQHSGQVCTLIMPGQEGEEIARLIAVAPDLLEALEYIMGHALMAARHANRRGRLQSLTNVAERARAALAKAREPR